MLINIIALITALVLSAVAAVFSIIGLTAIFSGAFWTIIIMGSSLEAAKVVTASWLYRNWKRANRILKYYLTVSVIVLMLITSMGIFGYLSRAHIEKNVETADNTIVIERIESKIDRENSRVNDAEIVLKQLDTSVQTLIDSQRIRGDDGAIAVRESQKLERESLGKIINDSQSIIDELEKEKSNLSLEKAKLEAEVGPVKYIAEILFSSSDDDDLERAVRVVIVLLVFVFDPVAILLLIAANGGLQKETIVRKRRKTIKNKRKSIYNPKERNIIKIKKDQIAKIN